MKLSNRKQLLSEADVELKRIKRLNEAPQNSREVTNMSKIVMSAEQDITDIVEKASMDIASKASAELTKLLSSALIGKKSGQTENSPLKSVRAVAGKFTGRFSDRSSQKISEYLPLRSMDISVTLKFENGKVKKYSIDDVIQLFF